jgi:hypothetical protein
MADLLSTIRDTVQPFADGRGAPDWQQRAARLRTLGQHDARGGAPDTCDVETAGEATAIAYDFAYGLLPEPDRGRFAQAFHQVESVERLAMSAIGHALCRLTPPPSIAAALCGVFHDEALHLQSLTALQGLPPCPEPWIAAKREPFWRLLRGTDDLVPYVLFQHCLSEAEGAIAGAEKLRQLQRAGAGEVAVRVAHRIFVEETRHALTGYGMLAELDAERPIAADAFHQLIDRYLAVESLVDPALAKGKRQRFALALAERYIAERDVAAVHAAIDRATRAAVAGEPI